MVSNLLKYLPVDAAVDQVSRALTYLYRVFQLENTLTPWSYWYNEF